MHIQQFSNFAVNMLKVFNYPMCDYRFMSYGSQSKNTDAFNDISSN